MGLIRKILAKNSLVEIRKQAQSDYLTGLSNRRGLDVYYSSLDKNKKIHAMFIDIDNFKRVNDVYGHSIGDGLLVKISELIKDNIDGFVARIGGDEYVAIFSGSKSADKIIETAERLIDKLFDINFRKDILSLVSLSIGIVTDQSTNASLDDVLYKCDAAMYQAKYNGKNQYVVYKEFDKMVEINRNIEHEMKDALKNNEFTIYLQPKVNMVSSKLVGAEALSRWNHPTDGIRPPMTYIPLFEKNGFISKLDMYMFEKVCEIKSSWIGKKYEDIPISVNMSRLHLYDKEFPDKLLAIAEKYGVNPGELELEITESVFIKDSVELIRTVERLKERGFEVSIDDFGSGFSALNLLKDIPVNTIKIDREFLRLSSDDVRGKKVIKNVISMCRDLKLEVVVEGVETKEQVNFITSCGCQVGQGYFYAKPLPITEFEKFADEYTINVLNCFNFTLDGHLKSEDGSLECTFLGDGFRFEEGIIRGKKSLHFPGGDLGQNTVNIPPEAIVNDSFTIAMWLKPEELHLWGAAIYVKFESGFCSISPLAWEGHSDFRIRDSREVNGWYDISACQCALDSWQHYAITYNAKAERAVFFINGEVAGTLDDVPTNRYVKWIVLGGDVFQPSFKGNISDVVIYNEAKDFDAVKELYDSYVNDENFIIN